MINRSHAIDRINLRLGCSSERQAQTLSDQYLRILKQEVMPALEQLFDRYDQSGFVFRIERLQIDLGRLQPGASTRAIADRLLRQMETELMKLDQQAQGPDARVRKIPLQISKLDAWKQFLITGVLPGGPATSEFQREIDDLRTSAPDDFLAVIAEAYRESGEVVLDRLLFQLNASLLQAILAYRTGDRFASDYLSFERSLREAVPEYRETYHRPLWRSALAAGLTGDGHQHSTVRTFWVRFAHYLSGRPQQIEEAQKWLPPEWSSITRQPLPEIKPERIKQGSPDKPPDFLYCANAGIVLLQPFLKSFFAACELLDDPGKTFRTKNAQYKAVYLLHYLAAGEWIAPEYQLALQKILCGLPVETPLPQTFELYQTEREEAQQLLQAVIGHWQKLGKTSPDGLREGFLQRNGKLLSGHRRSWTLQVEKKTMDVLLDSLPWSFSRIKLPWMNTFIRVEWTA